MTDREEKAFAIAVVIAFIAGGVSLFWKPLHPWALFYAAAVFLIYAVNVIVRSKGRRE